VEGRVSTGHSPPRADRVRALPSLITCALALVLVSLIWAPPALASSGQITGTVTSASTGDPLAEVRVCEYPALTSCAQTGPDGAYLLTGLAEGTYTIEFSDPTGHYLSQYFAGATAPAQATPVTVSENESTPNVDATMVLGGEVRGTVTNAATGEPLEKVEVCAENASFGECTTTNAEGEYAVLGLPAGSYTVVFEVGHGALIGGFEYLTQYYNDKTFAAEADDVVVSAGTTASGIDAAMSATTGQITGAVRDARTGQAIRRIEVCAFQSGTQVECRYTNVAGEYTIPNLPAGSYLLEFFDPEERGYVTQYYEGRETSAEADQVTVADGRTTPSVNAQMRPSEIFGRVTSAATGQPLAEVEVCVERECEKTAADGRYRIAVTEPGKYHVEFTAPSGEYLTQFYHDVGESKAEAVEVTSSEPAQEVNEQMHAFGAIAGTVKSAETEAPLVGAVVCAHYEEQNGFEAEECDETDGSGHYTLSNLIPGEYTVEIEPRGEASVRSSMDRQSVQVKELQTEPVDAALETLEATGPPTIAGEAELGKTLAEGHGTWTLAPTAYVYQWLRCDATGAGCQSIGGANEQTYAPVALDVGHELRVSEVAEITMLRSELNPPFEELLARSAPALSEPTSPVVLPVPRNTVLPTVEGTPQQGNEMTVQQGSWTNEPTGYTETWMRCDGSGADCTAIPGASGTSYTPLAADVGHELRVSEVAENAGGAGSPAESLASAVVTAAPPTAETEAASEITATGATLNASVNPNGSEVTECELEYGTSTAYGTSVPCPTPPGGGTTEVFEAVPVSGLTNNTEYHYRVSAQSAAGTAQANDETFLTLPHAPSVTAVSPVAGLEAGGTAVTITGTGFTGATAVRFKTVAATHYTVDSSSEITAESPAGKGKVDIVVSTASGTSTTSTADQFSYVPAGAAPTISALSVKKGPAAGGIGVIITGSHFVGVTAVRFGSASAHNVRVESGTFIAAVVPAGTTGPVAVTVTTPNGTSSPSSKTTFTFEAPTVTALSTNSGSKAGGTHLTVTGSGFAPGPGLTTFEFGKASAGSVGCTSTTTCTLISPTASKAGVLDVRAKVGTKTSKKNPPADRFTYN
jgi:hypothetical protein